MNDPLEPEMTAAADAMEKLEAIVDRIELGLVIDKRDYLRCYGVWLRAKAALNRRMGHLMQQEHLYMIKNCERRGVKIQMQRKRATANLRLAQPLTEPGRHEGACNASAAKWASRPVAEVQGDRNGAA